MFKILLLLVCVMVIFTLAYPQTSNADDNIISVFGPQPTTRPNNRGANVIVTPEPILEPTQIPQTFENNGQQCVCVPYYRCDPRTQTVTNDDVVVGFGVIDIRFNPESCQDVLDICCNSEQIERSNLTVSTTPVPTTPSPQPVASGCGIRNVNGIDFNITGNFNNEANFGEFPWTVALIRISDDACVCGGSLIHPNVVLTANHCVLSFINDVQDLKIRAGEWDTQTTKERLPYQERIASRIISHPQYSDRSLGNDVAIIELDNQFLLDQHINTICLPQPGFVPSSRNCFASGWGKDVFGKPGKYSVIQKRVELPIVPFRECQSALKRTKLTSKFLLHSSFICAGGVAGVDTCQGDGGAPLVCPIGNPSQNRYHQSGIVAWGVGCKEDHPAVYANVALAREWIDTEVRNMGLNTSYYTF